MAITITGITPATAPTTGGTVHYITGTDLNTVTGVTIGGTAVPLFQALSATLMKVTAPAGAAGAQAVVLAPGAVTLAGGITYSAAASTEQLVSTLARKFKIEVNTGTTASPTWTPVRAVTDLKPGLDNNLEEDDDYDSDGWGSKTKTMINWGLELKLGRKIGFSTGIYDPGQEFLRAAADQFGAAGSVELRWYDRNGGPEAYQGVGTVSWEPEGGEAKALDVATCKIDGQGKRNKITNPAL